MIDRIAVVLVVAEEVVDVIVVVGLETIIKDVTDTVAFAVSGGPVGKGKGLEMLKGGGGREDGNGNPLGKPPPPSLWLLVNDIHG